MNRKRLKLWFALIALTAAGAVCASGADFLARYKGTPFEDSRYHGGAQKIPGKMHSRGLSLSTSLSGGPTLLDLRRRNFPHDLYRRFPCTSQTQDTDRAAG